MLELLHPPSTVAGKRCTARHLERRAAWLRGLAALFACTCLWEARAQELAPAVPAVTPPQVLERVDAVYPPEALAARREGTVGLVVTVGADGTVTGAEVVESAGEQFDEAALAPVKQWRFAPARRSSEAIVSRIRVPFRFTLPSVETAPLPAPRPPPATQTAAPAAPVAATPNADALPGGEAPIDVTVRGQARPLSRGTSDYQLELGALTAVPRETASDFLKLVPGVLLINEGGEAHAEQVFLRGFDAREGQDIEFSVAGVPINESGNIHGNGYADTHFIIPELITSLRVLEGPFDPRQGNYAVAGSADYQLGWDTPGITAKYTAGSFQTKRLLLIWGGGRADRETFAGIELYQTNGWGEGRSGQRASAIAQVVGGIGAHRYRLLVTGYTATFHSAGVLREDDVLAGRGFFSTYDARQGEDASRISVSGELTSRFGQLAVTNQAFAIARPIRFRENFTGFLLDRQTDLQRLHPQRGDLIDATSTEWTLGARGNGRLSDQLFGRTQSLETGYFLRGDFVSSQQARIDAGNSHPYKIETDLDSRLFDIGMYVDANLRPLSWLALRGGLRADLFTFDVKDNCAVHTVLHPGSPPGDTSCLDQEEMGLHREPFQRSSSYGLAELPRGSILLGPFWGFTASASYGRGVRSIDPIYIGQDLRTPFASAVSREAGISFDRHFDFGEVGLRSAWFQTRVDKDLIFSQIAGRNIIDGGSTRTGSANFARLTGSFFDLLANLTYVYATFDDDRRLIPYIPDLVARFDGVLHGELPTPRPFGRPLRGLLGTGITYVGRRPLPYDERSNVIFTVDLNASLGWSIVDIGFTATNLFNRRYRLGEYNYVSDFHTSPPLPTLVPMRHFSAGAPRALFFYLAIHLGGDR